MSFGLDKPIFRLDAGYRAKKLAMYKPKFMARTRLILCALLTLIIGIFLLKKVSVRNA